MKPEKLQIYADDDNGGTGTDYGTDKKNTAYNVIDNFSK